jgi:DNA invertase Pin-like site-specific DNA recombinase
LVFPVFAALAEFERGLIREWTKASLEAARARGRNGGRSKALDAEKWAVALDLSEQRRHPVGEIGRTLGISRPTLYAYVRAGPPWVVCSPVAAASWSGAPDRKAAAAAPVAQRLFG